MADSVLFAGAAYLAAIAATIFAIIGGVAIFFGGPPL